MNQKQKRTITADDLYQIKVISGCQISPDGENIVYGLQTVDRESEKKFMNLWIIPSKGGESRQLTVGDHVDSSPKWSPDGKWIAFLSNRQDEKQSQLFIIPVKGGEGRPLTDLQGDISSFNWSPDSAKLVFQFRERDAVDVEMQKDERKKKLGRVSRRIEERVFFKLDEYGYLPNAHAHLWTVDIHTKETKQITETSLYDETGPVWSPDGKFIAYFSNRSEHPDLNPNQADLFLYDLEKGVPSVVKTPEGPKFYASFSPDGKTIAYFGHKGLKEGYRNTELWLVEPGKEDSVRSLTAGFDFNVGGEVINDTGAVMTSSPTWSKDGDSLYFQVGRNGRTCLHKIGADGKNQKIVLEFNGVVSGFSIDDQEKSIAYIQGTMTDPCQVGISSIKDHQIHVLTEINKTLFEQIDLGSFEEVWFKGADDNDLQGWILKPPNFDPMKKYPSIMEIHGGPMAQYGYFFMHEFFYLAAKGYVVYFCNPRGGRGYGEAHTKAIYHGKWGTVDYADLMCWADYMEKQPYIDTKNMGVTGGSYGGYMTVWIIGHTDRFKAAVSQRCVSNLLSMWGSSDFNWFFQLIFDDKAPYESPDVQWECSPIKHIGSATTPTLVIHSLQDLRCSIEQSEQVYVALKTLGVDTEFLIFPDSPHGVSRTGRTDRKIVRLEGIANWFERYLLA